MRQVVIDKHRIGALDGVRAIAIVLVLLYHMTPDHDSDRGLRSLLFKIADIGWSGVDLFFVLSGFLITGILLHVREGRSTLRSFYVRRLLRIVPAYFFALAMVFILVPVLLRWYDIPPFKRQWPYWLYVSNYVRESYESLHNLFYLSHFWSLAVEVQFYLLWPFAVISLRSVVAARVIAIGLIAAIAIRLLATLHGAHWIVTFGFLPCRMDGLLVGALIALGIHERWFEAARVQAGVWVAFSVFGLALGYCIWRGIASAIFWPNDTTFSVILRTTLPTIAVACYGALTILALTSRPMMSLLSWRGFVPVARYSYGAYIIHYLLLPLFLIWFGPDVLRGYFGVGPDVAIYVFFFVACGVTYALAFVSFHVLEKHFLAFARRVA